MGCQPRAEAIGAIGDDTSLSTAEALWSLALLSMGADWEVLSPIEHRQTHGGQRVEVYSDQDSDQNGSIHVKSKLRCSLLAILLYGWKISSGTITSRGPLR